MGGDLNSIPFALTVEDVSITNLSAPTSSNVVVMTLSVVILPNSEVVFRVTLVPFLNLLQFVNSEFSIFSWATAGPAKINRATVTANRGMANLWYWVGEWNSVARSSENAMVA
jgi:hypothetical protein